MSDNTDDLYFKAREIVDPAERRAFLEEACANAPELLAKVEGMLAAEGGAENYFGETVPDEPGDEERPGSVEHPGQFIGRYKLLQQIGEGGFGTVWMAEQTEPVKRRVALKVIKSGMDTKEVIARFEAERQALAMMDDPNIAKVLDAGATESGRPYFVMELVKGIPITQFCNERRLSTRRRLDLFLDVCSAVNHAHQKGVIHRDLKPSNILVTLHSDKPIPKVIDFGIAKATHQPLTEKTLFTRFDQFVGTPVYMSPEQAALSGLDIDTRSDIYSLGVLLYELLIGKPPFDAKSLLSAGYDEMRRIIREEEPLKPSSRLSTMAGDERTATAERNGAHPDKLGKLIRGDLDWIVIKAIEKDRARRYETANAVAADIRRYLNDEPVTAAAPSIGYKLQKFVRRNRTTVAVAATITVLLVAGITTSMWQAVVAHEEKEKAQYNEGLGWMLRAEVAEKEGHRYPDTLLYAARAIGFDGVGRPEGGLDDLPLLIRKDRNADDYERARQWIRERPHYLPVWSSGVPTMSSAVTDLTVGPTGRMLAVRCKDGSVRFWDFAAAGAEESEVASAPGSPARAIAFHPDGKRLAVAEAERVRFWDLEKGEFTEEGHVGSVSVLAISFDGRFLAGAAADGSIVVWDDADKAEVIIQSGQSSQVSGLTFGPDGSVLAAVFPGLAVEVYFHGEEQDDRRKLSSWETWAESHPEAAAEVGCVAFSPNGLTLAIGSESGGVSLWDVATAQLLGEVERQQRHTGAVQGLCFSNDGGHLGSASADATVKLWEREDRSRLTIAATLNGHGTEVTGLNYLPGGMLLASADVNGTVRLWDVSGRTGEKGGLYRYKEEEWYAVGTEQVDPAARNGFLGLPPDSVVALWQRGAVAWDDLFARLFENRNYRGAGALVAVGDDGGKRGGQLAAALLTDAEVAAAERYWHLVRLRLAQRAALGAGELGAARVAEIEGRLPGNMGKDFQIEERFEMVWCPPGSLIPEPFMMGDPGSQAEVALATGFWIGKHEITNSQYRALMSGSADVQAEGRDLPVVVVSWYEAREFCRRMTNRERLRGAIPPGWEYALPTSAQWEYACRAGTTTRYSFGDEEEGLDDYAWYRDNSEDRPHAVGSKRANPWGLHDMYGNVWEWTATYRGANRVARGGSFDDYPHICRSANRGGTLPPYRNHNLGFRPALVPAGQTEGDEEVAGGGERSGGGGSRPRQAVAAVLVAPDAEWKWLHPLDGVDPADADPDFHRTFHALDYDDTSWQTGVDSEGASGGFGCGEEGFEGVDIGTPADGVRHGAYFRHVFTTGKAHAQLELRCQRDDGIIVYLDGVEVGRNNMREGPDAYRLPAARAVGGNDETSTVRIPLKGVSLLAGDHVLAISLHNTKEPSSDLRVGRISLVEVDDSSDRFPDVQGNPC